MYSLSNFLRRPPGLAKFERSTPLQLQLPSLWTGPWTSLRDRWITSPTDCPAGRWTNGMDKRLRRPADRFAT